MVVVPSSSTWLLAVYYASVGFVVVWTILLYLMEKADVPDLTPIECIVPEKIWCRGYLVNISGASCCLVEHLAFRVSLVKKKSS